MCRGNHHPTVRFGILNATTATVHRNKDANLNKWVKREETFTGMPYSRDLKRLGATETTNRFWSLYETRKERK